ncbi:MAG: hypothetical protein KC708_15045 [Anaerolineae bacterium]|nr:hypothetical protein [Anaerolineae bacterium]
MTTFVELFVDAQHDALSGRDIDIMDARFGFQSGKPQTLRAVGNQFDLSHERIRQIVNRNIRRIRSTARHHMTEDDTEAPSAKLITFLHSVHESKQEAGFYELIDSDLDFLPQEQAISLILDLLFGKSEKRRESGNRVRQYAQVQQREKIQLKNATLQLERLIADVIWPDDPKIWQPDAFQSRKPVDFSQEELEGLDAGQFFSEKLNRQVSYHTRYERAFLMRLNAQRFIPYYLEYPFQNDYELYGKQLIYCPSIFFLLEDGRGIVVDLQPLRFMALKENLIRWGALRTYCHDKGMGLLVTDGLTSILAAQNYPVRQKVTNRIMGELKKGALRWPDYKPIRDELDISFKEFVALVLRNKLTLITPFQLSL